MKKLLPLLISLSLTNSSEARSLRGVDACFDSHIKSIQLQKEGNVMSDPVVELGGSERLLLTFDDLGNEGRSFSYKIILCDADWQESDLSFSEYIDGFQEDNINDYQSSFNTITNYVFHSLTLPNQHTSLKLSGNYKIQVMDSGEPEKVLFQKCFSVVERSIPFFVQSNFRNRVLAGNPECSQQMELKVEYPKTNIQNPGNEVKVRVTQNSYYDPQVPPPSPTFVLPNGIDFSLYNKNLYTGGSEFLQLDISSFEYRSLHVRKVQAEQGEYQVLLEKDAIMRQYFYSKDNNGKYKVHSARYAENSNTESDYAQVFFTLLTHRPLQGKVYLFGELTNWELTDSYQLLYSAERLSYELTLPLKQGYYDYRYVLVNDEGQIDLGALNGCSYEAENLYGIYVYYRSQQDRHDRLVNVTWVSSINNPLSNSQLSNGR